MRRNRRKAKEMRERDRKAEDMTGNQGRAEGELNLTVVIQRSKSPEPSTFKKTEERE